MNPQSPQFADLSVTEKLQLVEELWDQIAAAPESLPVPDWQKEELDRRKAQYQANPDSGMNWEDAKRHIRGSNG